MRREANAGMRPAAPHKLYAIEAGRGIAAIVVVLYHCARHIDKAFQWKSVPAFFRFGHAGVDFFFVISGFIIFFVHCGEIGNPAYLGRYLGRRFTRLMPTYWVAFLVSYGLFRFSPSRHSYVIGWPQELLLYPSDHTLLVGVAWTLRFEVLFYGLFAILFINRYVGFATLAAWQIFSFVTTVAHLSSPSVPAPLYASHNVEFEFAFGMLIAYLARTARIKAPRSVLAAGLLMFVTMATLEGAGFLTDAWDGAWLYYGVPSALIVAGLVALENAQRLAVPKSLQMLGAASYCIYLFQFIFIGMVWQVLVRTRLAEALPLVVQFVVLAAAAVLGGVLTSRYVEQPLIRFFRTLPGLMFYRQASLAPADASNHELR